MTNLPRYQIIPDYKHRTEGPTTTFFPPVPRTCWFAGELSAKPELSNLTAENIRWTPLLVLDAGEYDIGLVFEQAPSELQATIFSATLEPKNLGRISATRLGERLKSKNCARLSLREPQASVALGIQIPRDLQSTNLVILLIPRLGSTWRGDNEQLGHVQRPNSNIVYGKPDEENNWAVRASEFLKDFVSFGPYTQLEPGDYVAIFRLACKNWQSDSNILELDTYSPQGGQIASRVIATSDLHADKFMEFELPFSLGAFQESANPESKTVTVRQVEFRVKTLQAVDTTLAHIRLARPSDQIWERYFELGGIDSVLGPPHGAAFAAAPAFKDKKYETQGWLRRFAAGAIYWSAKHGACEVYGQIGALFEALGGTGRTDPPEFGFPTGIPEPVISSYGTRGLVQKFQGFRGDARIYAFEWNGIPHAHEIYGGIAHTYLRELDRHSSLLGFPLSGEYWEDETKKVRRNDFEGGVIRWGVNEEGHWSHLGTIFFPRPKLTQIEFQATVYLNDPVTVRIEADNHGGTADWGYLTLSFPDTIGDDIEVASDIETYAHKQGDLSYAGYGTRKNVPLQYRRIEGKWSSWQQGDRHYLQVTVRPASAGQFRVLARTSASAKSFEKYTRLGLAFRAEGDPFPLSEHPLDQQTERVYEHEITVLEKLLPELELVKTETPALVVGFEDALQLHIHNRGRGTARNLVILPVEKLGSSQTDRVRELLSDQDAVIEMEVTPVKAGNVGIEIHLQYEDEYGERHFTFVKSRVKVVKEGEQRATFVFEGDTVFVRPNFGPKDG